MKQRHRERAAWRQKGQHATSSQSPTSLTPTDLLWGHNHQPARTQKQPGWEMQGRKRTPAVCKDPLPRTLLPPSHLLPSQWHRCTTSLMSVRVEDHTKATICRNQHKCERQQAFYAPQTECSRHCAQATAEYLLLVWMNVILWHKHICDDSWLLYTWKNQVSAGMMIYESLARIQFACPFNLPPAATSHWSQSSC